MRERDKGSSKSPNCSHLTSGLMYRHLLRSPVKKFSWLGEGYPSIGHLGNPLCEEAGAGAS